jgi:hypothetical protein
MRPSYLWDYDIEENQFEDILAGKIVVGKLDQDWAARRLIEYAPYKDIVQQIGFARQLKDWSRWRKGIRSVSRKRGLDFLVQWLPEKHPELCHE